MKEQPPKLNSHLLLIVHILDLLHKLYKLERFLKRLGINDHKYYVICK